MTGRAAVAAVALVMGGCVDVPALFTPDRPPRVVHQQAAPPPTAEPAPERWPAVAPDADYERKLADAMQDVQSVELVDVLRNPAAYAGRVVRTSATYLETLDVSVCADQLGATPAMLVILAPPFRVSSPVTCAVDLEDYTARQGVYRGLDGALVDVTLFVSGRPQGYEGTAVMRVLTIEAR